LKHEEKVDVIIDELANIKWVWTTEYWLSTTQITPKPVKGIGFHFYALEFNKTAELTNEKVRYTACDIAFRFDDPQPYYGGSDTQWFWEPLHTGIVNPSFSMCLKCRHWYYYNKHRFGCKPVYDEYNEDRNKSRELMHRHLIEYSLNTTEELHE
jgi:hypothetical protein